jgi:hypothetical protein
MSSEPPKKKRKQIPNEKGDPDGGRTSMRQTKRVEITNDPTALPQVYLFINLTNHQKKYYRQRAHANVLSDHLLV